MQNQTIFTDIIFEIIKTDVPFVLLIILIILTTNHLSKNRNKSKFTNVEKNSKIIILCSLLFLFACFAYAFLVPRIFAIIAANKSLPSIFTYLAVFSNIEVITKNSALIIPILISSFNPSFRQFIGLRKSQSSILYCTVLSLLALLCLMIFSYLIYKFSTFNSLVSFYNSSLKFNQLNNIYLLLTTCFIIAISKETFFRGLLYSVLRKRLGLFLSIIITSCLAAIHTTWKLDLFILIFFQSCILTLVYEKTKSLYPSIAIHFLIIITPIFL